MVARLTYEQIGEVVGISADGAESAVRRARQKLVNAVPALVEDRAYEGVGG
jgi:DNA-directed RNA polymerase specialized sigma24 family protein